MFSNGISAGSLRLTKDLLVEVRYVGSKGTKLLQATSFTQGYDLNDPKYS